MARNILAKLNNRRGVSMIFALFFFLLCSVIGGVVLTAASVNAGKTAAQRQTRQEYLAVASAAALVEEDMRDLSFTGAYKHIEVTETVVTDPAGGEPSSSISSTESYERGDTGFTGGGQLLTASGIDLSNLYYSSLDNELGHTVPQAQSATLSFDALDADLSFPTVTGRIDAAADSYSITVTLQSGEQSLVLRFIPTVSKPVVSGDTETVESGGNTAIETVTTVYTTTVTWDGPFITEGRDGV